MNRKVRVWDKLAKKMIYPGEGYDGHYVLDMNLRFHNLQNGSGGNEYIVMLYTGLNDVDREAIWEFDRIEFDKEVNFLVFDQLQSEGDPDTYQTYSKRCIGTVYFHKGQWLIYPSDDVLFSVKNIKRTGDVSNPLHT